MHLGTFIQQARKSQKLRQKYVAKALGMDPADLCRVEKNKKRISNQRLQKIATAIGIEPELLLLLAGKLPDDIVAHLNSNVELYSQKFLQIFAELRNTKPLI